MLPLLLLLKLLLLLRMLKSHLIAHLKWMVGEKRDVVFLLKILISCVRRLNFVKLRESLVSTSHASHTSHTYSAIGPK